MSSYSLTYAICMREVNGTVHTPAPLKSSVQRKTMAFTILPKRLICSPIGVSMTTGVPDGYCPCVTSMLWIPESSHPQTWTHSSPFPSQQDKWCTKKEGVWVAKGSTHGVSTRWHETRFCLSLQSWMLSWFHPFPCVKAGLLWQRCLKASTGLWQR